MTPSEGFEAWFQEMTMATRPVNNAWFAKESWIAACAWQRERDAQLVESYVNWRGPIRAQLATAIRAHEQVDG